MKQHKIALEIACKRTSGAVAGRLPVLYDYATKVLEGKLDTSIMSTAPFKMNVAKLHVPVVGLDSIPASDIVRVTDVESGYYVKLTQVDNATKPRLMEIGHLLSVEEVIHGNQNTKAW